MEVEVGICCYGEFKMLKFFIVCDKIFVYSVDVVMMFDEKMGFIKVNCFSVIIYDEFVKFLQKLVEEYEMQDLVVDFCYNFGGYFIQVINMLSQFFLEKGKLLVYIEGCIVKCIEYIINGCLFYNIGEVVVLIDESLVLVSEIMVGVIQDYDCGVLVGCCFFGKGLVQEQYLLCDGFVLWFIVVCYYIFLGCCI